MREVFHEVSKQHTGRLVGSGPQRGSSQSPLPSQLRAQSILQRTSCSGAQSERFQFAQARQTVGQKLYTLTRQVFDDLLHFILTQFSQGQTNEQILQVLLPT
jgi:hypothetical protein